MKTKKLFITAVLIKFLFLSSQEGFAIEKSALVIGNSSYAVSPLPNPVNDAKAMSQTLRELGFIVDEFENLNYVEMGEAIRNFGKKLKDRRGLGLFYYAGHGIQMDGVNYLIPVENEITEADEVKYKSINAEMVLKKMQTAGNHFNIIIMDACRNNPFPGKFRSLEQGLAQMDAPTGSIIAYATAPGSTAADGANQNGLYTSHLLRAMKTPGLSVEEVFKQVRIGVLEESKGKQTPWESSSLTGYFEFVPQQINAQASPPPPAPPTVLATGHLQILSNIVGAAVYIDGVYKGAVSNSRSFYAQNLTENEVEVRLELAGYPSRSQRVKLKKGEWQQAYFEFLPSAALAPSVSRVAIDPTPPDNKPKSTPSSSLPKSDVITKTDSAPILNLMKDTTSGIDDTEILIQGHFSAHDKSQKSVPLPTPGQFRHR